MFTKKLIINMQQEQKMFTKKLITNMHKSILDSICELETKINNFTDHIINLANKQEMLLKAINEDRLVITKILEHLEKLEKNEIKKGKKVCQKKH